MKCLIIHGSPSKKYEWDGKVVEGFTGRLVREARLEMERLGDVSFEEIYLSDVNLPYCRGCYRCFSKGEAHCPHAALHQPIIGKMKEADCLILTSPVYALNVSALVKGFFDLGAYTYHRPGFFTKKALVISSTGGGMAKKVCGYLRDTLMHWGYNRVYTLAVIRMGAAEPTEKMKKQCKKMAGRLYKDTLSGRLHNPSLKRIFFYQLWRGMAANNPDSVDSAYWRESGLIGQEFSPEIRLGFGKRLFGKAAYGLIRKTMK